jgi:hypothetical protein
MVDYYSGDKSELYNTPLFMICEGKVTHWIPLPEPPKEEAPAGPYDLLYEEGGLGIR